MRFEIATGTPDVNKGQFVILLRNTGQLFVWGYNQDYFFNLGPNLIDGQ